MANLKKRVPENFPGDFFVDSTCIDCDACRQIALPYSARRLNFVRQGPTRRRHRPTTSVAGIIGMSHWVHRLRCRR